MCMSVMFLMDVLDVWLYLCAVYTGWCVSMCVCMYVSICVCMDVDQVCVNYGWGVRSISLRYLYIYRMVCMYVCMYVRGPGVSNYFMLPDSKCLKVCIYVCIHVCTVCGPGVSNLRPRGSDLALYIISCGPFQKARKEFMELGSLLKKNVRMQK